MRAAIRDCAAEVVQHGQRTVGSKCLALVWGLLDRPLVVEYGETMTSVARPIRIDAAFDDREAVRSLFERNAPYRAIAAYAPDGVVDDEIQQETERPVLPWFRGDWAIAGKPLVPGAQMILHNNKFLDAARAIFGTSLIEPQMVVVNLNGPMPAGEPHVDIPTFRGATRLHYPLPFLKVMGASGLFERWRVVQAGAVSWFYEGVGGTFDYWPDGLEGPMLSERPPFGNVAIVSDSDRMYHRIGATGDPDSTLPGMTAAAEIQPTLDRGWAIVEGGEVRKTYPAHSIRLSIVWKANVQDSEMTSDHLSLDRIMETFQEDLRQRRVDFRAPANPLADVQWILLLQRCYSDQSVDLAREREL